MSAILTPVLVQLVAAVAVIVWGGVLIVAWIAGLPDSVAPRGIAATNPKDRSI